MNMPKLVQIMPNFVRVQVAGYELYFSYQTLVAFQVPGGRLYVRENDFSQTTGKHLNRLTDKSNHIPGQKFTEKWEQVATMLNPS